MPGATTASSGGSASKREAGRSVCSQRKRGKPKCGQHPTTTLSPIQDVETTLIQCDLNDVARLAVALSTHPGRGYLAFPKIPLFGLVLDECHNYLQKQGKRFPIWVADPVLLVKYGPAVKKTRARLKLFDDREGLEDGLIDLLELAHQKSVEVFQEPHRRRGLLGWIAQQFQPDLGVSFFGEHAIGTTHAVLPALGVTRDEIAEFTPKDFDEIGKRGFQYTYEMGAYLAQLSNAFGVVGKSLNLRPEPMSADLPITHSDFIGEKVYRLARTRFKPVEPRFAGAIIMALSHINSAAHIFPVMLGTSSNLLFRAQFLTAYHASRLLDRAAPHLMPLASGFTEDELSVLRSRPLRNACAHYGLRDPAEHTLGANDPFGVVVETAANAKRSEVSLFLQRWLQAASLAFCALFSKSGLRSARALLGDHC